MRSALLTLNVGLLVAGNAIDIATLGAGSTVEIAMLAVAHKLDIAMRVATHTWYYHVRGRSTHLILLCFHIHQFACRSFAGLQA